MEAVEITLKEILRSLGQFDMALRLTYSPGSERPIEITVNQQELAAGGILQRPLCAFICDEDHLLETLGKILKLAQETSEDV